MTAMAAPSAEELQEALKVNLARLRSAGNYIRCLAQSDDLEAALEMTECWERIDGLLDERIALRARR